MWIKFKCTLHRWSFCFSTSIGWIHCLDQPKTFTLLLKSKSLDFETLSHVHVYRIEYVLYRQGPYRIGIVLAADRIYPALVDRSYLSSPSWQIDEMVPHVLDSFWYLIRWPQTLKSKVKFTYKYCLFGLLTSPWIDKITARMVTV